jgi:hypothetical protein
VSQTAVLHFWVIFVVVCFLALGALVAWVIYISSDALKRRKLARLGKREPICATEFYKRFYGGSGFPEAIVHQVRNQLANLSKIPAELIRPEDRLRVELAPVKPWEPDEITLPLQEGLFEAEQQLGVTLDYRRIKTVDDYIRTLATLRQSGAIPEDWKFPVRLPSRGKLALVMVAMNSLIVGGFLGLTEVFEKLGKQDWDWLPILMIVVAYIVKNRWIKRYWRRFEFGSESSVST